MTKIPKTSDESRADSDQMSLVSLSNRKVSQLADEICAIKFDFIARWIIKFYALLDQLQEPEADIGEEAT